MSSENLLSNSKLEMSLERIDEAGLFSLHSRRRRPVGTSVTGLLLHLDIDLDVDCWHLFFWIWGKEVGF